MRQVLLGWLLMLMAGGVAAGDRFWEKKQAAEWSDKEVAAMLSASPWAQAVKLVFEKSGSPDGRGPGGGGGNPGSLGGSLPGGISGGISLPGMGGLGAGRGGGGMGPGAGGPGLGGTGTGGPGMGGPGGGPGGGPEGQPKKQKAVVLWLSAAPVRQALARRTGRNDIVSQDEAEKFYLVAVQGLPVFRPGGPEEGDRGRGRGGEEDRESTAVDDPDGFKAEMLRQTSLTPAEGYVMTPSRVEIKGEGPAALVVFYFPRIEALTLDSKDVFFRSSLGFAVILGKFDLQNMKCGGKLEI